MGTSWSDDAKNTSAQAQAQAQNHPSNNNNVHNKPKEAMKELSKLPHNCEAIIRDSDHGLDKSSIEKLYEQLYVGVFLNGRRKKYWVEKKANVNCFMVFANDLLITWIDNGNFWLLENMDTSDHGNIKVAQLRNVCWLEVHGKFHTSNLTPGITYQITYIIKLENACYGWETPVNLRLILPNGTKQEHKESFKDLPKEEWVRVRVGEFTVAPGNFGEIEFSLYEYEGGNWKKGLFIKGASIEPKV